MKILIVMILIGFYTIGYAQQDYAFVFKLKPNGRGFVDETQENLGYESVSTLTSIAGHAIYAFIPDVPTFSLSFKHKKNTISFNYAHETSGYRGLKYPGFCAGNLPALRIFDYYSLVASHGFTHRDFVLSPSLGAVLQHGTNTYGDCVRTHTHHPYRVFGRTEYKTFGISMGVDIDYSFPRKDRNRIAKERYLIGLNGIYSHLPNEVDHYSYGLHLGMNFIKRNKNGKCKFIKL